MCLPAMCFRPRSRSTLSGTDRSSLANDAYISLYWRAHWTRKVSTRIGQPWLPRQMTGFDNSSRNLRLFRSTRSNRTAVFTKSIARSSFTSFDRISSQVATFDDLNNVRLARSVSRIRHRSRRLYSIWKSELVHGGWRFNMKSTPMEKAACSITFVSSRLVALIVWRVFVAAALARCALQRDSIR